MSSNNKKWKEKVLEDFLKIDKVTEGSFCKLKDQITIGTTTSDEPLCRERVFEKTVYRISKIDNNNSNNANSNRNRNSSGKTHKLSHQSKKQSNSDNLDRSELIAEIDKNLRHLHNQKRFLEMGRESKREKTWSDCFMANASVKKRSPRSPCRRKESREPERPVFGGEHVCAVLQKLFEKSSTKPEVRAPSISPTYRRSNREEVCSSAFEKKRKRQKPRRTKNYITTTRHPSDCSSIARTYGACCRNYAEQVCQSSTQPRTSICCCPEMFCRHRFTTTCDVISSSTTELSQCKTRYNQAPSTAYGSICTPQYTCHRNLCETDDSCVVPCSTYIASYLPPVCQNLLDDICPRRGTCPVSRVDSVEKDLCRMPYMPQTLTEEIGNYAYSHKLSPRNASCSLSSRIKPLRRESPSCSRPCTSKKALSSKCTSPIATIPSPFKDCTLSETTIKILECRSDKPRTSVEQKSSKRPITKVEKQTQACQTDELTINNLSPSSDTPRRSVTITNPNVIDDTTYVRPDNDQNEIYNIIPYVVPPAERRSSGYSGSPTDIPRNVLERSEVMVEDALSQESVKKGATSTVIKMESIREQMAKTEDILRLHAKPGYRRTSESSVSRSPRSSLSQPAFKARPGETALPLEPQPPSGFDYKSKAQSNVSQSPCSSLPKPEVENRRKSQCSAPRSTRSSLSQIKVPPNRESQSSAVRSPRGSISQPKIESRREPQTSARQPCMAAPQPDVEHRRSSQSQSDVPRSQRASSLQQKVKPKRESQQSSRSSTTEPKTQSKRTSKSSTSRLPSRPPDPKLKNNGGSESTVMGSDVAIQTAVDLKPKSQYRPISTLPPVFYEGSESSATESNISLLEKVDGIPQSQPIPAQSPVAYKRGPDSNAMESNAASQTGIEPKPKSKYPSIPGQSPVPFKGRSIDIESNTGLQAVLEPKSQYRLVESNITELNPSLQAGIQPNPKSSYRTIPAQSPVPYKRDSESNAMESNEASPSGIKPKPKSQYRPIPAQSSVPYKRGSETNAMESNAASQTGIEPKLKSQYQPIPAQSPVPYKRGSESIELESNAAFQTGIELETKPQYRPISALPPIFYEGSQSSATESNISLLGKMSRIPQSQPLPSRSPIPSRPGPKTISDRELQSSSPRLKPTSQREMDSIPESELNFDRPPQVTTAPPTEGIRESPPILPRCPSNFELMPKQGSLSSQPQPGLEAKRRDSRSSNYQTAKSSLSISKVNSQTNDSKFPLPLLEEVYESSSVYSHESPPRPPRRDSTSLSQPEVGSKGESWPSGPQSTHSSPSHKEEKIRAETQSSVPQSRPSTPSSAKVESTPESRSNASKSPRWSEEKQEPIYEFQTGAPQWPRQGLKYNREPPTTTLNEPRQSEAKRDSITSGQRPQSSSGWRYPYSESRTDSPQFSQPVAIGEYDREPPTTALQELRQKEAKRDSITRGQLPRSSSERRRPRRDSQTGAPQLTQPATVDEDYREPPMTVLQESRQKEAKRDPITSGQRPQSSTGRKCPKPDSQTDVPQLSQPATIDEYNRESPTTVQKESRSQEVKRDSITSGQRPQRSTGRKCPYRDSQVDVPQLSQPATVDEYDREPPMSSLQDSRQKETKRDSITTGQGPQSSTGRKCPYRDSLVDVPQLSQPATVDEYDREPPMSAPQDSRQKEPKRVSITSDQRSQSSSGRTYPYRDSRTDAPQLKQPAAFGEYDRESPTTALQESRQKETKRDSIANGQRAQSSSRRRCPNRDSLMDDPQLSQPVTMDEYNRKSPTTALKESRSQESKRDSVTNGQRPQRSTGRKYPYRDNQVDVPQLSQPAMVDEYEREPPMTALQESRQKETKRDSITTGQGPQSSTGRKCPYRDSQVDVPQLSQPATVDEYDREPPMIALQESRQKETKRDSIVNGQRAQSSSRRRCPNRHSLVDDSKLSPSVTIDEYNRKSPTNALKKSRSQETKRESITNGQRPQTSTGRRCPYRDSQVDVPQLSQPATVDEYDREPPMTVLQESRQKETKRDSIANGQRAQSSSRRRCPYRDSQMDDPKLSQPVTIDEHNRESPTIALKELRSQGAKRGSITNGQRPRTSSERRRPKRDSQTGASHLTQPATIDEDDRKPTTTVLQESRQKETKRDSIANGQRAQRSSRRRCPNLDSQMVAIPTPQPVTIGEYDRDSPRTDLQASHQKEIRSDSITIGQRPQGSSGRRCPYRGSETDDPQLSRPATVDEYDRESPTTPLQESQSQEAKRDAKTSGQRPQNSSKRRCPYRDSQTDDSYLSRPARLNEYDRESPANALHESRQEEAKHGSITSSQRPQSSSERRCPNRDGQTGASKLAQPIMIGQYGHESPATVPQESPINEATRESIASIIRSRISPEWKGSKRDSKGDVLQLAQLAMVEEYIHELPGIPQTSDLKKVKRVSVSSDTGSKRSSGQGQGQGDSNQYIQSGVTQLFQAAILYDYGHEQTVATVQESWKKEVKQESIPSIPPSQSSSDWRASKPDSQQYATYDEYDHERPTSDPEASSQGGVKPESTTSNPRSQSSLEQRGSKHDGQGDATFDDYDREPPASDFEESRRETVNRESAPSIPRSRSSSEWRGSKRDSQADASLHEHDREPPTSDLERSRRDSVKRESAPSIPRSRSSSEWRGSKRDSQADASLHEHDREPPTSDFERSRRDSVKRESAPSIPRSRSSSEWRGSKRDSQADASLHEHDREPPTSDLEGSRRDSVKRESAPSIPRSRSSSEWRGSKRNSQADASLHEHGREPPTSDLEGSRRDSVKRESAPSIPRSRSSSEWRGSKRDSQASTSHPSQLAVLDEIPEHKREPLASAPLSRGQPKFQSKPSANVPRSRRTPKHRDPTRHVHTDSTSSLQQTTSNEKVVSPPKALQSPRSSLSDYQIEYGHEPELNTPHSPRRIHSQTPYKFDTTYVPSPCSSFLQFPDTMHEMCAGISDPDTGSDDMPGFSHHKTHSFEVMFSTSQVRDERVSKSDLDLSTRGTLQDNDMRSSKSKKRSSTSIPDEGKRTSSILTPNADDDAFLSGAQFAYIKEIDSEIQEFIKYLQNRLKNCDETVRTQLKKLEEDQKIVEGDPSYCEKVCGAAAAAHIRMIDEEDVSPSNSRSGKGEVGECGPEKGIDFEIPELDLHLDSPGRSSDRNTTPCDCGCAYGPYFRRTVSQRSISRRSEIPPFTGCECMREDYYKIMRLAYG